MAGSAQVYRARWVIAPGSLHGGAGADVTPDGAVVVEDGRIVRVGPWSRLKVHVGPGDAVEHFAEHAILPGPVNAHTHLGLSDMAGRLKPTANFTAWVGRLTARLMVRGRRAAQEAVVVGARLAAEAGTAAGADMAHDVRVCNCLAAGPVRWTVFGELFRFAEAGLARLGKTIEALERLSTTTGLRVGLAPHAPYTAGLEVFAAARREADRRGWPVSTHLHETLDEIAFSERGQGTLGTWLRRLGVVPDGWRPPGRRPIAALAEAGFFAGPVLVAHANYLTDDDIAVLAASRSSVAYCPRSHAFFGHQEHPWRRLLQAGVNVCLGTDSLASSPSLSVFDEARFIAAGQDGADPALLLQMATVRGASALGLERLAGDIRPGMPASMCTVGPLEATTDPLGAIMGGQGIVQHCGRSGALDL